MNKFFLPLKLELHRSNYLILFSLVLHIGAIILLFITTLHLAVKFALLIPIFIHAKYVKNDNIILNNPLNNSVLHVKSLPFKLVTKDNTLLFLDLENCYNLVYFILLQTHRYEGKTYHILIPSDAMDKDDFRRLRLHLKYRLVDDSISDV